MAKNFSDEEDILCAEATAFQENYDKLSFAFPVTQLLPSFVAKKVITYQHEELILAGETDVERRRRLLKHIAEQLQCNVTSGFYTLLEILENCGVQQTAYLATEIRLSLQTQKMEYSKLNDSGK